MNRKTKTIGNTVKRIKKKNRTLKIMIQSYSSYGTENIYDLVLKIYTTCSLPEVKYLWRNVNTSFKTCYSKRNVRNSVYPVLRRR